MAGTQTLWNGLTCSTVAMRPGYAQIEFTSPSDVPSTRWFIDDICVSK